jgi:hypothetical protein
VETESADLTFAHHRGVPEIVVASWLAAVQHHDLRRWLAVWLEDGRQEDRKDVIRILSFSIGQFL